MPPEGAAKLHAPRDHEPVDARPCESRFPFECPQRSKKQGLRTAGRATQRCFLKRQLPCCWLPARRRGGGQSSKGWAGLFISPVVIIIRRCWRWAHNHVFVGLSDSVLGAFGFLSNARWSDAGRHARSRR